METVQASHLSKRIDWRANIFRVLAALVALFLLAISVTGILAPWGLVPSEQAMNLQEGQSINDVLWYAAIWVAYATFFSAGTLLVLIWKPRTNPLLMQFWVTGWILVNILFTISEWPEFDPTTWIAMAVLVVAYPETRSFLRFKSEGVVNKKLLVLGVITGLAMLPVFWKNLQLFFSSEVIRQMSIGPLQVTYIALLVPLGAFLMATNRPGWKIVSIIVGVILIYLGLAGVPNSEIPGSWGILGGLASLVGGLIFLTSSYWANQEK